MRIAVAALLCVGLSATSASAQIMTQATRFAAPGEDESKKESVVQGSSDAGINLLPQASVNAGSTGTEVGVQVGDFYLTSQWRFYVRTNLPVKSDAAATATNPTGTTGAAASPPAALKPSDRVVAALFDEFGGVLNTTAGYYRCLQPWRQEKPCADAKPPDHGLFLDTRVGLKFIDLPAAADATAPKIADVSVTPFYTGVATLRLMAPLFDDSGTSHLVGGLALNASFVVNAVADRTLSDLFKTGTAGEAAPLRTTTSAVVVSAAVNLGGAAYLSMSGTPWSSDSRLGKRFVVGLNIARPTKDAKGDGQKKAPGML